MEKCPERSKEHEDSRGTAARAAAIHNQISSKVFENANVSQQETRQDGLVAHLETWRILLRQGVLELEGHTDKESNVIQFNKDKS